MGGKIAGRLALRARWQEEANNLHVSGIIAAHTHMHAAVFRLADRSASSKNRLAMLRSNHDLRGASSCRYNRSHALDRCTVLVMAALVWIPVMRLGRRRNGCAGNDRQGDESETDDLHAIYPSVRALLCMLQRITPLRSAS